MINPFDLIIEKLERIESQLAGQSITAAPAEAVEIIDRKELCKRAGISVPTLSRLEKRGDIPVINIGGSKKYNWQKVVSALEKKRK